MTLCDLTTLCGNAHVTKLQWGLHLLFISSVLCKDGKDNYEQLVHWGEFGSKCLDAWRQHRSGHESGDDAISAVILEAMSVRSNAFSVGKSVFV